MNTTHLIIITIKNKICQRGGRTLLLGQRPSSTVGWNGLHSYVCFYMASLGEGLHDWNKPLRFPFDGINVHVSMTNVSLQVGGNWLRFDMERDRFRQGLLAQDMLYMNDTSLAFNPDMRRELVSWQVNLQRQLVMGLMIFTQDVWWLFKEIDW